MVNIKSNIVNPKMSNLETDFQNPTIVENINNNGGVSFIGLDYVKIQNDRHAHATLPPIKHTKWIRCSGFNFNLPDNSIIEGIEVQIDDFDGIFNDILAQDIYLVLNGVKIGIDKESGTPIGTADTDTYRVYGNPTDMWNTELTQIDIESSTFGVQIFYYNPSTFVSWDVNIDNIQIKVYYSIVDDDNDAPTYDTLTESNDPLELGNTETININVYDESTISFVYIEINNVNYTMDFISGDTYRNSTWTPITIGIKNYSIWLIDEFNNINWTGVLNITVQDTKAPTYDTLTESNDPLELGNTETININVYDESTISFVYIEINNVNYTMDFISGDTYRNSTWTPITIGIKNYSIWLIDEFNNINWTGIYDITVIEPSDNDFIIISGLIGIFSIFIFILMFSILLIKEVN